MFGSKIDNLQKLKSWGINNIPDFEIVSFADAIDNKKEFANFLKNHKKSEEVTKYLDQHLKTNFKVKFKAGVYAVRSSSNLEDGAENSFAGQFQTFLQVEAAELSGKIRECFLSLASENVVEYLKKKNIHPEQFEMNVLVQQMVQSEISGVIFTANPQGLLNETVITVGEGLGEGVVSEKVTTTSYFYNTTDDVYYFDGAKNYLSAEQVKEIIETSKKIRKNFQQDMDIEFAISKKKLYILQARPITTLNTKNPLVLDNSNIVESYPGISLPLTISFAELVYSSVFESECRRMLRDESELKKLNDVFGQMVGACNGRLYYKISNWYALIDYLPFRSKITPIWEEMLGIESTDDRKPQATIKHRVRVAKNYLNELRKIPKNMEWLNEYFVEVERDFRKNFSNVLDLKHSIEAFHQISEKLVPHWDYTLINDMYAFINVGIFKKQLKENANEFISNISNLESMLPVQEMIRLAYIKDEITPEEYKIRFNEYIQKFGDRNVEELKLESKTFRTNPELLEQCIEEYRKDPKQLKKLYYSVTHPVNRNTNGLTKFAAAQLKRCETGIKNREISRLNRSRIFGMVRDIFNHIADLLVAQKFLSENSDIYYLTIDEIEKFIKKPFELKNLIRERKEKYKIYRQLPAYSKLVFAGEEFDKLPQNLNSCEQILSDKKLHGTGCSDGRVTAKVVVVNSEKDTEETQGKIIVTKSTDPGWVFMLSTSKGVISERGSLLSHTAIISRELNIPAVVGVKDATKILKTGDLVTIDGHTGEIILEKQK